MTRPVSAPLPTAIGFLSHPTRHLFFTGKGGVGKTSLSTAAALTLADGGKKVLLVSTDAASNLDEMLGIELHNIPVPVPGAPGLQTRAVVLSPSGPQNFEGDTYAVELTNVGDSFTTDLFGLVQYDAPLNTDDLIHSPTSVTFDFGVFGIATIMGESFGLGNVLDPMASAFADYFGEIVIDLGNGTAIIVTIADTAFGAVNGIFTNGRPGVGMVTATFTLASPPLRRTSAPSRRSAAPAPILAARFRPAGHLARSVSRPRDRPT